MTYNVFGGTLNPTLLLLANSCNMYCMILLYSLELSQNLFVDIVIADKTGAH